MRTMNIFQNRQANLESARDRVAQSQQDFMHDALKHVSDDSVYKSVKKIGSVQAYCVRTKVAEHEDGAIYEIPTHVIVVTDTDAGVLVFPMTINLSESEWGILQAQDGYEWKSKQITLLSPTVKSELFKALENLDADFSVPNEGDKYI